MRAIRTAAKIIRESQEGAPTYQITNRLKMTNSPSNDITLGIR